MNWRNVGNNKVLDGKGFYISYNPDCSKGMAGFVDSMLGLNQKEETAIVMEDLREFYILNGDHRKEYESRISDLNACIEYFLSNQDLWSPATDLPNGQSECVGVH